MVCMCGDSPLRRGEEGGDWVFEGYTVGLKIAHLQLFCSAVVVRLA